MVVHVGNNYCYYTCIYVRTTYTHKHMFIPFMGNMKNDAWH